MSDDTTPVANEPTLEQMVAKYGNQIMKLKDVAGFVDLVFDTLKQLKAEIAALKADHAALAAKALTGGLPWAKGTTYAPGDVVQHDGSLWRCIELHGSGANFSHEYFVLQVKHGRDGRDLR